LPVVDRRKKIERLLDWRLPMGRSLRAWVAVLTFLSVSGCADTKDREGGVRSDGGADTGGTGMPDTGPRDLGVGDGASCTCIDPTLESTAGNGNLCDGARSSWGCSGAVNMQTIFDVPNPCWTTFVDPESGCSRNTPNSACASSCFFDPDGGAGRDF
jgi:hypothetical protein